MAAKERRANKENREGGKKESGTWANISVGN
jgi:hypothetical protein